MLRESKAASYDGSRLTTYITGNCLLLRPRYTESSLAMPVKIHTAMVKRSDTDSPSTLCSMSTRSLFGRTVHYMMTEHCRSEVALPIDEQCGFTSELSQSHERHVPCGSILHAFAFDHPPPYFCDSALWNASRRSQSIPRSMQDRRAYNQPQFWKTTLCICTKDHCRMFLLGSLAGQSIAPVPMSVGSGRHHLSSWITLADTLALGVVANIVEIIVDGIILDAKDVVSLVEPAMFTLTATTDIQSPSNHKIVPKVVHRPWEL
ncbi:hypothetical protein EDD85DRAFT_1021992 [Armillaria nabsnona]|nr:hypothetical protein EDD85DRAFT_1021992 [Armillaria nabsnona]